MEDTNALLQSNSTTQEDGIKKGDVVELDATATYYDGRIIPLWVKKDQWIVSSVNGDRIVINRNVSGTHQIQSAVRKKYLRKIPKLTKRNKSERRDG